MSSFALDLSRSGDAFTSVVWPTVRPHLDGGDLLLMEGRPDVELARLLDMKAGIDGWQIHPQGMRGIASRVQVGRAWDTFTIRLSRDSGAATEFSKRRDAISSGRWVYPAVTVQAYLGGWDGPVLSVGVALTKDIIAFIEAGLHEVRRTSNASFAVASWAAMRRAGYRVKVLRPVPS